MTIWIWARYMGFSSRIQFKIEKKIYFLVYSLRLLCP
jgi:hypothetical protein